MDQDKTQNKGMPDQDLDASQAAGRQKDVSAPSRGKAADVDYDQQVGDPTISVKQFTNDVEFIDNRGPLGAGD